MNFSNQGRPTYRYEPLNDPVALNGAKWLNGLNDWNGLNGP